MRDHVQYLVDNTTANKHFSAFLLYSIVKCPFVYCIYFVMSSSGWELVGRNKKDKNNGKNNKLTKAEKKKFIENAPKVEDFLPLSQVKTLYDTLDNNKENKKPPKEKENKTKEYDEKKKQQKQQQADKKKQEPKEKVPKTINDALNMIDPNELSTVLTNDQIRFPEAPLIWLKDLAAYLNLKIPLDKEDTIFSGKPKDYPLSIVPKPISSILEKAIQMAGEQTSQLFYENTLTAMATDMVKGSPVVGHKVLLQLLARINPEMTIANIGKLITVRNSYQNRKTIGLSLLWALSQAGRKNLSVGLKMWHEVMSPMLEAKNYSSYVSQIFSDLVFEHENVSDLKPELYLDIIDDTCSGKLNIPAIVGREVNNSIERLRLILFQNKNINYAKLFELLIGQITQKVHANYRDELIKALVACLVTDPLCFSVWRSLYIKNLYQSQLLLTCIDIKWNILHKTMKTKCLKEICTVFQTTDERWRKSKDEGLANSCSKICKVLLLKMTASSNKKFPWRKGIILLLLLTGAFIGYDVYDHGHFKGSNTNKLLHRSGLCEYGQKAWTIVQDYSSKALEFIEANSPEYYKATVETCKPYIKLSRDIYIVMRNISIKMYDNAVAYAGKNGPVVLQTIEHYVPGMLDEIRLRSNQGLELVKVYSSICAEKFIEHFSTMLKWLEHNVFVGKLSPENLQNYASKAIDTTQTLASQTYDWVYEKVQTLSKVP
ncbi:PREDICTED: transmembrane protein 214-A [Dufourea novaeangliae]|uniref:transmembrane protein 214-A n=1 Tax=Dufourea novaeangliae TaxID=178035 RepID=UPI00076764A3|nr:PREDICTED: transmembrane protein 214-A [Dufourea novaeangliae]